MEVNPLNIFFVKSDSKGDRLLFRYPYATVTQDETLGVDVGRQNPYALSASDDHLQNSQSQTSNIWQGELSGFTDEMLSTLFAVKPELCNRKFELKVNDVRFVGHPTLLPYRVTKDDNAAMILINIVFALQASASHSIVKCYYDLSKRLGKALRHEEKRCSYLTEEMKIMLTAHDEVPTHENEENTNEEEEENSRHSTCSSFSLESDTDVAPKSPFQLILQRSSLARSMKCVFEELSSTGIVQVRINKWVLLSFCLPHKAHQIHNRGLIIEPETIDKCLQKLRPYHGILLMVNPNELLESIPLDGSPALLRLIKLYSPLKSLQTLAIEADLTLSQVFQLTGHLVYWAKATLIYPLCESNVYVVSPGANIHVQSPLVDVFANEFPGMCLLRSLSEFSLPAPLWYHARSGAGGGADVTRLPRVVAWLLRRRLLLQLHTYVHFNGAHWVNDTEDKEYYCEKHDVTLKQSCNMSNTSLNQLQLNVPEPVELRKHSKGYLDTEVNYPTENNLNQTDFSHTKPIVIESELKRNGFEEVDSANHSFDDGIDVVDCNELKREEEESHSEEEQNKVIVKKLLDNSVDSGISNGNGFVNRNEQNAKIQRDKEVITIKSQALDQTLTSRLSDTSLKDSDNASMKDSSSDDDKFESDPDLSPRQRAPRGCDSTTSRRKNGISLNLKQVDMSFQQPTMWDMPGNCDAGDVYRPCADATSEEAALALFTEKERQTLATITIAHDPEDMILLAQLHKKGYLHGEHHLEEIMFMESVTRSQLMQLLDKFKEVLITFETEDPAVAMLY